MQRQIRCLNEVWRNSGARPLRNSMKVLVSAFSCGPGRGSEPGVGWSWVQQLSRYHELWVLTTDEFKPQIQQAVMPSIHPVFIPSFKLWHRLQQQIVPALDWLYYDWWQWKAYRVARKLHEQIGFDLAHHVTFVSWRAPSFISLLPVPFIWGPIGGGGTPPRALGSELGWKGRLSEGFRALCQRLPGYDPAVRLTMSRASVILANIRETANLLPIRFQSKVRLMFGIGIPDTDLGPVRMTASKESGFTVLFAAQLRPIKGGTLALKAFAALAGEQPDAQLIILGEGSERGRLEALAAQLGIRERVRFLGWLSHPEVLAWMKRADVLLHPSLRDSGGMVLLESMVQGKPVVCLDLGGPGHIVSPDCGFKVPPGSPDDVVWELAAALQKLARSPELRVQMGEAGRARVKEMFDWKRRGKQMAELYDAVVRKQALPAST